MKDQGKLQDSTFSAWGSLDKPWKWQGAESGRTCQSLPAAVSRKVFQKMGTPCAQAGAAGRRGRCRACSGKPCTRTMDGKGDTWARGWVRKAEPRAQGLGHLELTFIEHFRAISLWRKPRSRIVLDHQEVLGPGSDLRSLCQTFLIFLHLVPMHCCSCLMVWRPWAPPSSSFYTQNFSLILIDKIDQA